ncbi:hypothetical protein [Pseudoxanthomonas mexicana]|uniref:hypothetical protein n=1 Tax=Pseudoxanthomonas mexicana TaxID=128785 RepID=UPI00398ABE8F
MRKPVRLSMTLAMLALAPIAIAQPGSTDQPPPESRSVIKNGNIHIRPENRNMPSVIIPNTVGARGIRPRWPYFHDYQISTPARSRNPATVANAFAGNPTPGDDDRASPQGTLNNAGHVYMQPDFGVNLVRSFTVKSPDPARFTDITVNYTVDGHHMLNEGFLLHFGEILPSGQIVNVSYGEGNAFRQGNWTKPMWWPEVRLIWENHHREINRILEGR